MLLGYGVDPLGILVPFVIFAIGVSHGVQKISAVSDAALDGADGNEAARRTFRLLFVPAIVALLADLVGFVTILAIPVEVIREMAITASLGVGVVILTDLILLPVLVSFAHFDRGYAERIRRRQQLLRAGLAARCRCDRRPAGRGGGDRRGAACSRVLGFVKGRETPIGDTAAGVPELRKESRYNRDTDVDHQASSRSAPTCSTSSSRRRRTAASNYDVMRSIDEFAWHMANVEGVRDVDRACPACRRCVSAGWSEGNLKWRNLPRNTQALVQAQGYIDTSTGLLNKDCSVMPVMLFLADHRAGTIERVVRGGQGVSRREPRARASLSGSRPATSA